MSRFTIKVQVQLDKTNSRGGHRRKIMDSDHLFDLSRLAVIRLFLKSQREVLYLHKIANKNLFALALRVFGCLSKI